MRRIERLLNLVAALLEARRPLTAEEIRARIAGYGEEPSYEAFRRAFERDKDALREMGVPVEVVPTDPFRDQADGYTISKSSYYLPRLELENDELAALRLAADTILGADEAAESGFLKLSVDESELPPPGPTVVWGADVAAEQPVLTPLYTAVTERRTVRFEYAPAGKQTTARTVEPYGLIHRRGHWYVVGRDRDRDAVRSFKLNRIRSSIESVGDRFEPPPGFDPERHLAEEPWEIGEGTGEAVVRFDPVLRWWAEQNLADLQQDQGPDGSIDVTLPVANLDALISWVIGFGEHVEIREPAEARVRLLEHLSGATRKTER